MNLVQRLAKAVNRAYRGQDTISPGVTVSELGYGGEWYVSIVRFPVDVNNKQVVASAKGRTLDEAALGCAIDWLIKRKRTGAMRQIPGLVQAVAKELAK